jgi:DNA-directed RNA polymerase
MDQDLLTRQIEMEEKALNRGIERFNKGLERARNNDAGHETEAGIFLLKQSIRPCSEAIAKKIAETLAGRAARRAIAVKLLRDVEPDLLAYMTIQNIVSALAVYKSRRLSSLAQGIAAGIEVELKMAAFEERSPALYGVIMDRLADRGSTPVHVKRVMNLAANRYGVEWEGWTVTERLHIGMFLIDAVSPVLDWLEIAHVSVGHNKSAPEARPTQALLDWLKDRNEKLSIIRPALQPMIVPPRPWRGLRGGGYRSDHILKAPVVKRMSKGHRAALEAADLTVVHEALNAIQETRWRVNAQVLGAAGALWAAGAEVAGLPSKEILEVPPKPFDIEENEEARNEWKRSAKAVHEANAAARSGRILTQQIINSAEDLVDEAAIYMPHNLDFRGRVYARPGGLNPQGNDLCRGLLTFAEGKPLGDERGVGWLAIHGANCFGVDKVSHPERIDWVFSHTDQILAVAEDPIENGWWHDADSPWCFLAFCFEWAGYCDQGFDFASSLPIALDGSCNGLQHFSAMLRDPIGGAAVNLIPANQPQDIYGEVAKAVVARLKAIAADPDHPEAWVAQAWVSFGIDRKITKRPVMVLPYGGTQSSCRDYVIQAVREKVMGGKENPFGDELTKNASWLGGQVWASIGEVVVAAKDAMDWLKKMARVATKYDVPLQWETPSGFVAHQAYMETKERRVTTRLHGEITQFALREETAKLDTHKQSGGISPNFVHSLDGAALTLTVVTAKDHGITQFAMIHDSYGTYAADTDLLCDCLKSVFVKVYEEDTLAKFRDDLLARLPAGAAVDIPPLPKKGNLDLAGVMDSAFFFS